MRNSIVKRRIFFPRRLLLKVYLSKKIKEPYAIIEGNLEKVYRTLRKKGWKVDVYSLENIILPFRSISDGIILESYEAETITGEYMDGEYRYHTRMWLMGKRKKFLLAECHYEPFPTEKYLTKNPIKWMILAIRHVEGKEADYKKGLEYLVDTLKRGVKIYSVRNM